jgi:hypothetical protein
VELTGHRIGTVMSEFWGNLIEGCGEALVQLVGDLIEMLWRAREDRKR